MFGMSWDDYETFCSVADSGGFSAAAKALQRPKSSISNAVARLELSLDVRLLERTTRQVQLTEAGESLYSHIKPLFAQLHDAQNEAISYSKNISGTLRIAAPYEYAAHHLAPVACQIMAQHPQLKIQIDTEYAQINPLDDRYDIVFSMIEQGLPSTSIIARRVFSLEQGIFAAPKLLAEHDLPKAPQHLNKFPVIATSAGADWSYVSANGARRSILLHTPRMRTSNAGVRLQAAIAGLGVVRITRSYCDAAVSEGLLINILADYDWSPIHVYALFPTRRLVPSKVRVFLDGLAETHDEF
jgi:DNA-binding transcriptional LysR family regulator